MRTQRFALLFLVLAASLCLAPFTRAQVAQRIGVPVEEGYDKTTARWMPTLRYLEGELRGTRFTLSPIRTDEILTAIRRGEVEFAIIPASRFPMVQLQTEASAIASATVTGVAGERVTRLPGSILALRDRTDLNDVSSAKGKRVLAFGADSLSGWLAPSVLMQQAGIDPEADLPDLRFANDAKTVLDGLHSGVVDVAVIGNSDLLEAVRSGKAQLDSYRVLRSHSSEPMESILSGSTEAFPFDAFVKSPSAKDDFAQRVADALYRMPSESEAAKAAGYSGWTVPQSYSGVAEQLRAAGIDPARTGPAPEQSFFESPYWSSLLGVLIAVVAGIFAFVHYRKMRAQVRTTEETLDAAKHDLVTTQQALERAGEIRSSLLANFRQDFRTPLSALLEISRLLRTTHLSTAQAEYVNAIRETTHNLMGSIGNVTDFASTEAGTLQLERRDFDLMEVVDAALLNVYEQMGEHFAELSVQVDTNVHRWLNGDSTRLRQILQNLLHNAMKFTRSGDVLLHVSSEKDDKDAATVRFTVIDTGVGMEKKQISKVFEPYVVQGRGRQVTRGLGLPLCKRLVEKLGGQITGHSEPGKGSQFTFSVPFKKQDQLPVLADEDTSKLKDRRILLIGGGEISRRILQYYLRAWGCKVSYAPRFEDSLDVMRKEAEQGRKFDVVFCPAFVADRNAVELVATVRDHPEFDGVPFVVIASRQECEALPQLEQLAGVIIIDRPVRRGDLVLRLTDAVRLEVPDRMWKDPSDYDREEIHKLDFEFSDSKIKRGHVLVADANSIHQRAVALVLDRMGYEVTTTLTGTDTASILKANRFDLVFLETAFTDKDSFQVVGELRTREQKPNRLPVIGMMSQPQEGDREHCLLSGMDDCIQKPLDMETIARTMRRWTRKATAKPAVSEEAPRHREMTA